VKKSLVVLSIALLAQPAWAGLDVTIQSAFTLDFPADVVVDFEGLSIGQVLEPGDPITGLVTFGGPGTAAQQRAIVADDGTGNHVLRQIDLGAPGPAAMSEIAFTIALPARSLGAFVDAAGNATNFFPQVRVFEANGDITSFVSVGGPVIQFFGMKGQDASIPIAYASYNYATESPPTPMELDDLTIDLVPEPHEAGAAGASLAALVWLSRRRARA
jgi:hypothetical protein